MYAYLLIWRYIIILKNTYIIHILIQLRQILIRNMKGRNWLVSYVITITIYFISPSGKLKLLFNCTMKNISQIMNHTHIHTLSYAISYSKPKLPGIMLYLCKPKRKNSQIKKKSLGSHIPNPLLETDVCNSVGTT